MFRTLTLFALLSLLTIQLVSAENGAGYALRFYGHGVDDIDRVKIAIDPPVAADVSQHFTLEWWMKANPGDNSVGSCNTGNDAWIYGNIIFDRDVYFDGDYGDYGISLGNGRLMFGVYVASASWGTGICSTSDVTDGDWHHVAVTRNGTTGDITIFVDGVLEASGAGPSGDISYRDSRPSDWPNSDPYLVIGAEKHDAGALYPSYSGWIDEVRLSDVVRYTTNFTRPTTPFSADANTVALYHFNEGSDDMINDSSGHPNGPSHGQRRFGGSAPAGPVWVVSDAPIDGSPTATTTTETVATPARLPLVLILLLLVAGFMSITARR